MGVSDGISEGDIAKVVRRNDAVTARGEIRRIIVKKVQSSQTNGKEEKREADVVFSQRRVEVESVSFSMRTQLISATGKSGPFKI
jgi:hypothetical protein